MCSTLSRIWIPFSKCVSGLDAPHSRVGSGFDSGSTRTGRPNKWDHIICHIHVLHIGLILEIRHVGLVHCIAVLDPDLILDLYGKVNPTSGTISYTSAT